MRIILIKILYLIILGGLFGCISTNTKSGKKECSDYRPMCGMWGAFEKCYTTTEGCYQCECVNSQGNPNYPSPKW